MSDRKILDITPLDPDIVVITDWLAGELGPAESAAVEQRLRDDDAFFMKAGPIVKLWNLPIKFEDLLARHAQNAAPLAAAAAPVSEWARATAAAIVRGVGTAPRPAEARRPAAVLSETAPAVTRHAPAVPTMPLSRGERLFRFWFGWAGETKPAGPGHYWARIKYAYGTMFLLAFGHDRRLNAPETAVDKSPMLSLIWTRVEQGLAFTGLAAIVLTFGLGLYASYQDADDS
jgi:hypothetical protein